MTTMEQETGTTGLALNRPFFLRKYRRLSDKAEPLGELVFFFFLDCYPV